MQNRIKLVSQSAFHLIQVAVSNESNKVIRASFEVLDPDEGVIGHFGGLKEAQSFIKLLSRLGQKDLASKRI